MSNKPYGKISNATPIASTFDRHPKSENQFRSTQWKCGTIVCIVIIAPLIAKIAIDISGKELISYSKDLFSYIGVSSVASIASVLCDRYFTRK